MPYILVASWYLLRGIICSVFQVSGQARAYRVIGGSERIRPMAWKRRVEIVSIAVAKLKSFRLWRGVSCRIIRVLLLFSLFFVHDVKRIGTP